MSTYLWIDLGAVLFPFLFSFHPRLRFYRQWWAFWPAVAVMMSLFVPWDVLFTRRGVWSFGQEHLCGTAWLGLPLEEWLFFVCVPYACVFTYHCFRVLGVRDVLGPYARAISGVLVIGCGVLGLLELHRAYTASTFIGVALWVGVVAYGLRAPWLGRSYFAYLVLQVPFLVVNGLLTGTALASPVVCYNAADQLGLRIGTIPVEDTFYGLLMLLVTITIYEGLLGWKRAGIPEAP